MGYIRPRPCGLSPPTRGNLQHAVDNRVGVGSIPAHAGEPPSFRFALDCTEVYPRPRGGTCPMLGGIEFAAGLSPPTRGNLSSTPCKEAPPRSIPAHAGEPATRATPARA